MAREKLNPDASEQYKFKGFQLTEANIEHLRAISQGNMSFTVRKLIDDAWKAQNERETK